MAYSVNAPPFIPGGIVAAAANAPPFVPKSKQLNLSRSAPASGPASSSTLQQISSTSGGPVLGRQPFSPALNTQLPTISPRSSLLTSGQLVPGTTLRGNFGSTAPDLVVPRGRAEYHHPPTAGAVTSGQSFGLPDGDDPTLGMTSTSTWEVTTQSAAGSPGAPSLLPGSMPLLPSPDGMVGSAGSAGIPLAIGVSSSPGRGRAARTSNGFLGQAAPAVNPRLAAGVHRGGDKLRVGRPILIEESIPSGKDPPLGPLSKQQPPQKPGFSYGLHVQQPGIGQAYPRHALPQRQATPPLQPQPLMPPPLQLLSQRSPPPVGAPKYGRSASPAPIGGASALPAPVAAATHGGATYFFGSGSRQQGGGRSSIGLGMGSGFASPGGVRGAVIKGRGSSAGSNTNQGYAPILSKFMAEDLREELRRRSALIQAQVCR